MSKRSGSLWEKLLVGQSLRFWTHAARKAQGARPTTLDRQHHDATLLRYQLDRVIDAANHSRATASAVSAEAPHNADWTWHPAALRDRLAKPGITSIRNGDQFGSEVSVFHDCDTSEISLRQVLNRGAMNPSAYHLLLEVFAFDGSFLSLAFDLPDAGRTALRNDHVIRANVDMIPETPLEVFVRLNVAHGANTETQVRELPRDKHATTVEFDLAYMSFDTQRVSSMWIDVIFESPRMNALTLRDLTMCRFPRAQM